MRLRDFGKTLFLVLEKNWKQMNRLSWLLSLEKEYGKGMGKTTLVKKVAWD